MSDSQAIVTYCNETGFIETLNVTANQQQCIDKLTDLIRTMMEWNQSLDARISALESKVT